MSDFLEQQKKIQEFKIDQNDYKSMTDRETKSKLTGHMQMMERNLRLYSVVREDWMQKEWLEKEELPDEVIEAQVKEAYQKSHDGKKIGFFEKPKAKKEAKKRFKNQARAVKAYQKFSYDAEEETTNNQKALNKLKANDQGSLQRDIRLLSLVLDTKEERNELLQQMADAYTCVEKKGMTDEERTAQEAKEKEEKKAQAKLMKPLFDKMKAMTDFSKFDAKNDDEIMVNYIKYQRELNAGFVLSAMTGEYERLGGKFEEGEKEQLKAVALTLQNIKAMYENRLFILQSPFYTLIRESNFANKSSKELDALKTTLESYGTVGSKYENREEADERFKNYLAKLIEIKNFSAIDVTNDGMGAYHYTNSQQSYEFNKKKYGAK